MKKSRKVTNVPARTTSSGAQPVTSAGRVVTGPTWRRSSGSPWAVVVGSGGDAVEEAEHGGDPPVGIGGGDVEADDERLGPGRPEAPAEAGDVVVGVDRADRREDEAGELRLHPGDGGVQRVQP